MKKSVFLLLGILLTAIIAGFASRSIKKTAEPSVALTDSEDDSCGTYSDTLVNQCVEALQILKIDSIADTTILFGEVRKAVGIERRFVNIFNALHPDSPLSDSEKADSMANETYAKLEKMRDSEVTSDMIECIDKQILLDRYRELLCYRDFVTQHSSMPDSQKNALLDETIAWHKFYDAITDFAIHCVQIDFFTGGSMFGLIAHDCVSKAQKCRVNSLNKLLHSGILGHNDVQNDYEEVFVNKLSSRASSLYDVSLLEYIDNRDDQKRYARDCENVRTQLLPRALSSLKQWEKERNTLVYTLHPKDNNRLYNNDLSSILTQLTEIVEISY